MNQPPLPSPPDADPLDALLQHDAERYVADDGFTARVLTALPRRASPHGWVRPVVLGVATLLGSALALWLLPPAGDLIQVAQQSVRSWRFGALLGLLPALAVLTALGWGLFALAAEER